MNRISDLVESSKALQFGLAGLQPRQGKASYLVWADFAIFKWEMGL